MEQVYEDFRGKGFEFFLIYTREAHPGEKVPAHESFGQKLEQACRLRDEERLSRPILVDNLNGAVHQAYGALDLSNNRCPRLQIIDKEGIIVFKATWSDAKELRLALEQLLLREARVAEGYDLKKAYLEKIQFPLRDLPERKRVLVRAGQKSIDDWEQVYGVIKDF